MWITVRSEETLNVVRPTPRAVSAYYRPVDIGCFAGVRFHVALTKKSPRYSPEREVPTYKSGPRVEGEAITSQRQSVKGLFQSDFQEALSVMSQRQ